MKRILVVNPNSSVQVTQSIIDALEPLGDHFEIIGNSTGPETIRTDDDVAQAAKAFVRIAASRMDAVGFVTACFSDPGLDLARTTLLRPVTGAQEAAILEAATATEKFGVIALSQRAIPRHLKRIEALGYRGQLVDELALEDVTAAQSGSDGEVYRQILLLGRELLGRGAGAIVLGCAGMALIASKLGAELGIPVIDPVAAAGRLAIQRAAK